MSKKVKPGTIRARKCRQAKVDEGQKEIKIWCWPVDAKGIRKHAARKLKAGRKANEKHT